MKGYIFGVLGMLFSIVLFAGGFICGAAVMAIGKPSSEEYRREYAEQNA